MKHPPALTRLIDALQALPGVGPKSAQRLAFRLMQDGRGAARELSQSLEHALEHIGRCKRCRMLAEGELCPLCASTTRDDAQLCVVESPAEAEEQIRQLSGWEITHNHERIARKWVVKNFMAAMRFFNDVAKLAEEEGHHPDLHLVGYRNVTIEIWTHAIGGLSENDFILAAKIDRLPVELKP